MHRINDKFLNEMVKVSEYISKKDKDLLASYGFNLDPEMKKCTQREINEICELLEKVRTVEDITKDIVFTPKDCGKLISLGKFEELCICIKNGYRGSNQLRKLVGKEVNLLVVPKKKVEKPQPKVYQVTSTYDAKTIKKLKDIAASMNIKIDVEEANTEDLTV